MFSNMILKKTSKSLNQITCIPLNHKSSIKVNYYSLLKLTFIVIHYITHKL